MNIRVRDNKIYLLDESKEWIEITDIVANKVKLEKHKKNKFNVFRHMIKDTMRKTCNAIKQAFQDTSYTSYITFFMGMICGYFI